MGPRIVAAPLLRVAGIRVCGFGARAPDGRASRNFVDYQLRRAWGEDLCQLLVQPIYVDNSVGPVTHTSTASVTTTRHKSPRARYYTVQTGDTFGSISAKTGTRIADLERLNPGVSSNTLRVGQKLRVK